jgi:hypothetical protein
MESSILLWSWDTHPRSNQTPRHKPTLVPLLQTSFGGVDQIIDIASESTRTTIILCSHEVCCPTRGHPQQIMTDTAFVSYGYGDISLLITTLVTKCFVSSDLLYFPNLFSPSYKLYSATDLPPLRSLSAPTISTSPCNRMTTKDRSKPPSYPNYPHFSWRAARTPWRPRYHKKSIVPYSFYPTRSWTTAKLVSLRPFLRVHWSIHRVCHVLLARRCRQTWLSSFGSGRKMNKGRVKNLDDKKEGERENWGGIHVWAMEGEMIPGAISMCSTDVGLRSGGKFAKGKLGNDMSSSMSERSLEAQTGKWWGEKSVWEDRYVGICAKTEYRQCPHVHCSCRSRFRLSFLW